MKRTVACLLIALLAMMPLLAIAESEAEPEAGIGVAYVVNPDPVDRLNMRSAPETGNNIVGRYYTGTAVTILEESGEYSKVRIGPTVGYIQKAFLSSTREDWVPGIWATVSVAQSGEGVNVRRDPSKESVSHGLFFNGSVFQVLEETEEHYKVRGMSVDGYIQREFLILDGSSAKQIYTPLTWAMVEEGGATLWSFPADDAYSMGTYAHKQQLRILGTVGTWYYVEISGSGLADGENQRGFMPAESVHVGNYGIQSESTAIYAAVRTPSARERLPLRAEKAAGSSTLGLFINTSQVILLDGSYQMGDTFTWWPVQVGDLTGYVQGRYLDVIDQRPPSEW